jgi:hypothetical protein
MLTDSQISKINNFLENKVFNYTGKIVHGVDKNADFDFKFKILGYKKMISVGEWYDYTKISLTLFNFRDDLSKLLFTNNDVISSISDDKINSFWNGIFKDNWWFLSHSLSTEISTILRYFDDNIRVVIEDYNVIQPKKENIQEQKMSRQTIRTVVRDITNIIKLKKEGDFYLPKNSDFYSFSNFPVEFSVELYIVHDLQINNFKINADYSSDDEVIEVVVVCNPKKLESNLYNIVGELNEVIAHELEHSLQNYRGELEFNDEYEELPPLEYYQQPHEILAQIKGFKRLSNLRKKPIGDVINQWFNTHRDIHGLSPEEEKIVINRLMSN